MPQKNLTARAFWVTAPGRGELLDGPLFDPKPNEVLIRTLYTGISRGTESRVFRGEVPPSQYQACLLYTSFEHAFKERNR